MTFWFDANSVISWLIEFRDWRDEENISKEEYWEENTAVAELHIPSGMEFRFKYDKFETLAGQGLSLRSGTLEGALVQKERNAYVCPDSELVLEFEAPKIIVSETFKGSNN